MTATTKPSANTTTSTGNLLQAWYPVLNSSLGTLRRLAGTTENEFLKIGARMQEIHQRAFDLSATTRQLVEAASGEHLQALIDRLREIIREMDNYLGRAQSQSDASQTTLDEVSGLLKAAGAPLAGVKRMCKHLYILEVSIKIESAHIGEMGSEFINLAVDIKKLSQQIKDKVNAIQDLRTVLDKSIRSNSSHVEAARMEQETKAEATRSNTATSLTKLETVNDRFSQLGGMLATVADENSNNISTIVQSMQFHDIYRQQVEHVVEAIEGLFPAFAALKAADGADAGEELELIGKVGDVCELQQAQLQFASSELYQAVVAIVDNLKLIGSKQKQMTREIFEQKGSTSSSGASFIDEVSKQMTSLTSLLGSCAKSNAEVAGIMRDVSGTVSKITGFVTDIEGIGRDIIQIALNARIKASSAGELGASLSVLAEEIGQLSNEAVDHTDLISKTLAEIDSTTAGLSAAADSSEDDLTAKLTGMTDELSSILGTLNTMGDELTVLLGRVKNQISFLSGDIDKLTGTITVHEKTKALADKVLEDLKDIFSEARRLHPASAAFKEDLRAMAQRYTMESERRIHESIASRHGVNSVKSTAKAVAKPANDSEFGDNVDLF
ncbi:MAG: methyl-accepting chemotaxis protein [Desulforhopalus sp.]|nr:methyl-accepting chemotaxis protein [Desulforhopalus sp.]